MPQPPASVPTYYTLPGGTTYTSFADSPSNGFGSDTVNGTDTGKDDSSASHSTVTYIGIAAGCLLGLALLIALITFIMVC